MEKYMCAPPPLPTDTDRFLLKNLIDYLNTMIRVSTFIKCLAA
jgi:hypothetical protein